MANRIAQTVFFIFNPPLSVFYAYAIDESERAFKKLINVIGVKSDTMGTMGTIYIMEPFQDSPNPAPWCPLCPLYPPCYFFFLSHGIMDRSSFPTVSI